MNKLFKYLMGVFILGICFINTTHAETFVITGNFESYNNDNTSFDPISFNASFYNSSNTVPTIDCTIINANCIYDGEKSADGSSIHIETDCTTSTFEIDTQLLTNIYIQGNNLTLPGFYSDLINDGFNFNYPVQYIPAFGQIFQLDYYYPFSIQTLSITDHSNCEDIFGYACNFIDMQILGSYECNISGNVVNNFTLSNNSCPNCEEQYTSLQCQTEYNLIPINDVTANYCKLNFDLIEPTDCPGIGEGTGEINRTARYINNVQYPGTASLRIDIADFLEYSTTYNSGETLVDIIGVDADEDYINNIIDKEQLTPTKDDFAYLISNLGDYIPLLAIAGLMIRAWRIIKKVF